MGSELTKGCDGRPVLLVSQVHLYCGVGGDNGRSDQGAVVDGHDVLREVGVEVVDVYLLAVPDLHQGAHDGDVTQ